MKKESNRKNIIIYTSVIVLSALFIIIGNKICQPELFKQDTDEFYKAKVVLVDKIDTESFDLGEEHFEQNKRIYFTAAILNGPHKGKTVEAIQDINTMNVIQPNEIKSRDKIIISKMVIGEIGEEEWFFVDHNRSDILTWFVIIFLLLVLILGRRKGLSTIISLIFTVLAVFAVFIPSILKGYNIYLSTIVISIFITLMSMLVINGANKKTACAIAGNIGGVAVAGVIAVIMSKLLNITGIVDEDYVYLMFAQLENPIDLIALVWSGIVIGSLGAIMDVAMSIASAMNELAENMEEKTFSRMLKSGMNIGRDAIGTMTNTLILAYVGSSLATVLLLIVYNKDILFLFNMEMIVIEVLQSIAGSMGILFAVPATSLFSAYVFNKK